MQSRPASWRFILTTRRPSARFGICMSRGSQCATCRSWAAGSQTTEEPVGFVGDSEYASAGAATGAWVGGLLGLCVGAAFLVLPGVGPIVVAGPLSAAVLAGIEGAIAGTALGGLAGALVGWGVPKEKALKYETHVKGGKFLVIIRGEPEVIARAAP